MKLTRLTIREYTESLVVAFILAMIIRHYVVEAFRIPTASMEPTLIGNETNGDRILVSKFEYDLHPPRQWDVIVFKIDQNRIDFHRSNAKLQPPGITPNPNGTINNPASANYVNYVKRLVGLPGQTIQVRNGDLFVDGTIARKPPHAQDSLLVPVTNDDLLEKRKSGFFEHWARNNAGAKHGEDPFPVTGRSRAGIPVHRMRRRCHVLPQRLELGSLFRDEIPNGLDFLL